MADRLLAATVTVAAGTTSAAPASTALPPAEEIVDRVELTVPNGHVGLTGLRIFYAGEQIIPFRGSTWIIANDAVFSWPFEGLPTGGQWIAKAYNTDRYEHSFYLRFLVRDIPPPPEATGVPLADIVGASIGESFIDISNPVEGT